MNTLLDAVNAVIGTIGQAPVNSLDEDTNVDVINAKSLIATTSTVVQARGWWFNTFTVEVHPDALTGRIPWLTEWLTFQPQNGLQVIQRNGNLYNLVARTDVFTQKFTASVISLEPFESLPVAMRIYIVAQAARKFEARSLGDDSLGQKASVDEMRAWADLQDYEITYGGYNLFNQNPSLQQWGQR